MSVSRIARCLSASPCTDRSRPMALCAPGSQRPLSVSAHPCSRQSPWPNGRAQSEAGLRGSDDAASSTTSTGAAWLAMSVVHLGRSWPAPTSNLRSFALSSPSGAPSRAGWQSPTCQNENALRYRADSRVPGDWRRYQLARWLACVADASTIPPHVWQFCAQERHTVLICATPLARSVNVK